MSTTTELPYIDHFVYTTSHADAAQLRLTERSRGLYSAGLFRYTHLTEVQMLCPIFERIEHELGIQFAFGTSDGDPTSPEVFLDLATPTEPVDKPIVALVRNGAFVTPLGSISVSHAQSFPSVRERRYEGDETYPNWKLGGGAIAGSVAPGVITLPWWYSTGDSTPEQLDAIYRGLKAATETAISPDLGESLKEALDRLVTERITSLLAQRGTFQIDQLREEVPDLVTRMHEYEQQLTTWNTRLNEVKAQLQVLDSAQLNEDQVTAMVGREIAATTDLPDVTSIRAPRNEDRFEVFTTPLELTHPESGQTVTTGSYRILLRFGSSPHITVHNLTRRIGNYDHPHIADGAFCLGEHRRLVDELLSRTEISTAVALVIDLLKQINPNDVYTSEWEAWFDLPEGEDHV